MIIVVLLHVEYVIADQEYVIDFESLGVSGSDKVTRLADNAIINGYQFLVQEPDSSFTGIIPSNPIGDAFRSSSNHTKSLAMIDEDGGSHPLVVKPQDGKLFHLLGFDAAEFYKEQDANWTANAIGVKIEGLTADSHSVQTSFFFDMASDGFGGTEDFEHFTPPDTFRYLKQVTFTGIRRNGNSSASSFILDNIVVDDYKLGYSGGSGTKDDPYQIAAVEDLLKLGDTPSDYSKHFKLVADLDLDPKLPGRKVFTDAVISPADSDKFQFSNYNYDGVLFEGSFDGNDHRISNLVIRPNREKEDYVGLFGYVKREALEEVAIKNLILVSPSINANGIYSGSLAGYMYKCTLEGCHVEDASIMAENASTLGALVGRAYRGRLLRCSASGSVTGGSGTIGGLVGFSWSGWIDQCYANTEVLHNNNDDWYFGGLLGKIHYGNVSNSYATGSVQCGRECGGVGGLLGGNDYGTVDSCYAVGPVRAGAGSRFVGGLIGYGEGRARLCYWDMNTSGQTQSRGGRPNTTEQLMSSRTYAGWGYGEKWTIAEGQGYPHLAWEGIDGASIVDDDYAYGGGHGTRKEPYEIYTAEHLNSIGLYPDHYDNHFILMSDIEFDPNTETGFNSIGTAVIPFSGLFDGNGHTVSHLQIFNDGMTGMFGYIKTDDLHRPAVKNLALVKPRLEEVGTASACLVGTNKNSVLQHCRIIDGRVHSSSYQVGLLVGSNNEGIIEDCHVSGLVDGYRLFGGIAGWAGGRIVDSSATCSLTGTNSSNHVGCLVGSTGSAVITRCFAEGTIEVGSGTFAIGGLIGEHSGGEVTDCYAGTHVTLLGEPEDWDVLSGIGGFIGRIYSGKVHRCYAAGSVNQTWGRSDIAGFAGKTEYDPSMQDCFYLWHSGLGWSDNGIGTSLSPHEMMIQDTFSGWDFVTSATDGSKDYWKMSTQTGYPELFWVPDYPGSGTLEDPFEISTPAQFAAINNNPRHWDKVFVLARDINLHDISFDDSVIARASSFSPDDSAKRFRGILNGNGYDILNLYIDAPDKNRIGLLGCINDQAVIKDLSLLNCQVTGGDYVGALVGWNAGGQVSRCSSRGAVNGDLSAGGLVGYNENGLIDNCYAHTSTMASNQLAGGLVGRNEGIVVHTYSTGPVMSPSYAGGLIGGSWDGQTSDSFWDMESSGLTTSFGGTGKTTSQMQDIQDYLDAGWDFVNEVYNGNDDIWQIAGNDYPAFVWHGGGPVAHWPFDETSGAVAIDKSGSSHGTVSGASWTEGIVEGALYFDGADDVLDCGNDPVLSPALLTISLWLYPQDSFGSPEVLSKGGSNNDIDYKLELFGAKYPTFVFGNGTERVVVFSSQTLPNNEWTHVTLTRDVAIASMYIDGVQVANKAFDFAPISTDYSLIIGGPNRPRYRGKIDDLMIYDKVLDLE